MKRVLATLLLLTLLTSGGGRLIAAQRPLPAPTSASSPGVHYDFACPQRQAREHTGDEGPPGNAWFSAGRQDVNLEIQVNDRQEHVTASPLAPSPERPFEIETRIYFQDRAWTFGYALVRR